MMKVLSCDVAHPDDDTYHPGGHVATGGYRAEDDPPAEDRDPVVRVLAELVRSVDRLTEEIRKTRERQ